MNIGDLSVGSKIKLIKMSEPVIGKSPKAGDVGEVKLIKDDPMIEDAKVVDVAWENGSELSLLSDEDEWEVVSNNNTQIEEQIGDEDTRFETLYNMKDFLKYADKTLIKQYLDLVRESGIVNMFQAGFFLIYGSKYLDTYMKLKEMESNYSGKNKEGILEMADKVRDNLIRTGMQILDSKNKEISTDSIGKMLRALAADAIKYYMFR